MIRRSPTRIELKLDDIQEFDYVHFDKKKPAQTADNVANISAATAAKLLRHERIGYHRPEANMARRTGGPPLCNPTSTASAAAVAAAAAIANAAETTPVPASASSQQSSNNAPGTNIGAAASSVGVTATSTPLPASEPGTATTSEPANTPSNLDPANLPSEIEAGDSIYMDLAEFNSTYASANMSMDES